jgi:hypothetical protein
LLENNANYTIASSEIDWEVIGGKKLSELDLKNTSEEELKELFGYNEALKLNTQIVLTEKSIE